MFKVSYWQCWKTTAIHLRMILLVEWSKEENKDLAPLEPVVEKAGSTSTCFAYSTFGSRFGGAASEMVHWERCNKVYSLKATDG